MLEQTSQRKSTTLNLVHHFPRLRMRVESTTTIFIIHKRLFKLINIQRLINIHKSTLFEILAGGNTVIHTRIVCACSCIVYATCYIVYVSQCCICMLGINQLLVVTEVRSPHSLRLHYSTRRCLQNSAMQLLEPAVNHRALPPALSWQYIAGGVAAPRAATLRRFSA